MGADFDAQVELARGSGNRAMLKAVERHNRLRAFLIGQWDYPMDQTHSAIDDHLEILAALECVDGVVIFDEPTPREIIAALLPDVLVKGGDWASDQIIGREEVEARGGQVITIPVVAGYSTTAILEKIRKLDLPGGTDRQ